VQREKIALVLLVFQAGSPFPFCACLTRRSNSFALLTGRHYVPPFSLKLCVFGGHRHYLCEIAVLEQRECWFSVIYRLLPQCWLPAHNLMLPLSSCNSILHWLCLRQPSSPSVCNSLQPFEAFAVLNLSQPAIANAELNSESFFQLLHNKKFVRDRFANGPTIRSYAVLMCW